ncbi:putative disease resistance protein [Dorcoceras hygrometricum]|uniref:Putative disease resistance protein n=1 Tax=Dorcoceras hygrometricum TaxID=472368 RepID=A0A2Z6ZRN8_9LAMI|nr:putative disease resistance protein [Dorcoceras hygrometricum]
MRAGRAWWLEYERCLARLSRAVARLPCALDARRWAGRMSGRAQTVAQVAGRCCAARDATPRLMLRRWKLLGRRWASLCAAAGRPLSAGCTTMRAGRAMGARRCAWPRVALGVALCGCRREFFVVAAASTAMLRRCRDG